MRCGSWKKKAKCANKPNAVEIDPFRAAAHPEGAARAVNKGQIAMLCQSLEGIFSLLKKGTATTWQGNFGALSKPSTPSKSWRQARDGDSLLNTDKRYPRINRLDEPYLS